MGIGKRKAEPGSFDSEDIGFLTLKPVLTVCPKEQPVICSKRNEEDCVNGGCETPKCQENKILEYLECEEDCVNGGCETPKCQENKILECLECEEDCVNGGCETPKCQENKIPECLECPPAPRKPKPRAKRKPEKFGDFFFVPADLGSVFLPYQIIRPRKKIHWSTTTEPGLALK